MVSGDSTEMAMVGGANPRPSARVGRNHRIEIGKRNVRIATARINVIAAGPEFRDQEMCCHRARRAARVTPESHESPIVPDISRPVAGVTIVGLIIDKSSRRSAAAIPDIARL